MKTKTMKKALSIFLAVLMIALALPFTLLTVAAEEQVEAVAIKNATTNAGLYTESGKPNDAYAVDKCWDGDFSTAYIGRSAGNIDFELQGIAAIDSFTIWGGSDKTSKAFTNHEFTVRYSIDGVTWETKEGFSFVDVCGNATKAGTGSESFDQTKVIGDVTYYGVKLDFGGAIAKYIRIEVAKGRIDKNWATLREVDIDGTVISNPTSVAGIQQGAGGIRLVGATDSLKAEGVGFKLDITHTYEAAADAFPASIDSVSLTLKKGTRNDEIPARYGYIDGMIDGDLDVTYGANNYDYPYFYSYNTSGYVRTFYYDQETGKIERDTSGTERTYHGYAIFELSALSELNSATIWLASDGGSAGAEWSDPTKKWNICDAYDILISTDGETWTLMGEYDDMCGDGTNKGANFPDEGDADYDERTIGRYKRVGHKIDLKGKEAAYVAIAIKDGSNNTNNRDAVIGELTVDGVVVADTVEVTKTATYTTDATNVVYNSILADGETITAKDIDEARYDENDKLYALGITGIPTNGTVSLEVTPYFIPVNSDTKVYGDKASFEFIDGKALDVTDTVKTMTYNINNGQVNDKIASARLDYIAAQINTVDPDIVLLGEAHNYETSHYNIAMSDLTAKCDVSYGIVEFTAEESTNVILYNTEKFTLLKSEYLELGYGKAGEFDAVWKRDAVIAKFKRISDNREILAVATHLSTSNGKDQIRKLLTHVWDNYADVEMRIIAGDLNVQSLAIATAQGNETASNKYVHENSFANKDFADIFYTDANVSVDTTATFPESNQVIDYIYTTNLNAKNYQVLTGGQASNASDHNAVYAELVLN